MIRNLIFVTLVSLFTFSCVTNTVDKQVQPKEIVSLPGDMETVPAADTADAADDPAIWIHPTDPGRSLIIGTNKKRGLDIFDLNGNLIHRYDFGRLNNVDVRYGFPCGNRNIDIVAASNRTDNSIFVAEIDAESGALSVLMGSPIRSELAEVYGFCLFHDKATGRFFAFINSTDGAVEQWQLSWNMEFGLNGTKVRTIQLGSQTEGCVTDDELGMLYIGEEDFGIWKFPARPEEEAVGKVVDQVTKNPMLQADIEGLTIFYAPSGGGYLIASSQGNNSYAVYDRLGDNDYLGSFRIIPGETIDGTYETDGIDVTSIPLGPLFPFGLFIAQDGTNETPDGQLSNQNFKVVGWEKISPILEKRK